MYAFAVFKNVNYIFCIESVPAYIGGQFFLSFLRIIVPKCSLSVRTSEGISFLPKIFREKARKWVCISAPFVQMSEEVFKSTHILR